jgi:thymidylate synthase
MRVFNDVITMVEEIRRDISKSPIMISSRVQGDKREQKAHEAMNYSYSIPANTMPGDHHELAVIGSQYFDSWSSVPKMVAWLVLEYHKRFHPLDKTSRYSEPSEDSHPILSSLPEGGHYGYTYRERMIGMLASMESVLSKDLYSRRAYWPIFEQRDSHRASDYTRIPCTLGYHFAVREIPAVGPQLHITINQRSGDFNKFWLSDLWFGHCAQKLLAERLSVACGIIHHHIISFHAFIEGEIY